MSEPAVGAGGEHLEPAVEVQAGCGPTPDRAPVALPVRPARVAGLHLADPSQPTTEVGREDLQTSAVVHADARSASHGMTEVLPIGQMTGFTLPAVTEGPSRPNGEHLEAPGGVQRGGRSGTDRWPHVPPLGPTVVGKLAGVLEHALLGHREQGEPTAHAQAAHRHSALPSQLMALRRPFDAFLVGRPSPNHLGGLLDPGPRRHPVNPL